MRYNKKKEGILNELKQKTKWFNLSDYDICKGFNLAEWAINIKMRRITTHFMQSLLKNQEEINKSQIGFHLRLLCEQFLGDRKKLLSKEGLNEALKLGIITYNQIDLSLSRFEHPIIRTLDKWDIARLYRHAITHNKIKKDANQKEAQNYYFTPYDPQYIWINLSADTETLLKNFKNHISSSKKNIKKEKKYQQRYLENIPKNFNNIQNEPFSTKLYSNFVLPYYDLILFVEMHNMRSLLTDDVFINEYLPPDIDFSIDRLKLTKNLINRLIYDIDESYFISLMDQAKNELQNS